MDPFMIILYFFLIGDSLTRTVLKAASLWQPTKKNHSKYIKHIGM